MIGKVIKRFFMARGHCHKASSHSCRYLHATCYRPWVQVASAKLNETLMLTHDAGLYVSCLSLSITMIDLLM